MIDTNDDNFSPVGYIVMAIGAVRHIGIAIAAGHQRGLVIWPNTGNAIDSA